MGAKAKKALKKNLKKVSSQAQVSGEKQESTDYLVRFVDAVSHELHCFSIRFCLYDFILFLV